MKCKDVDVTLVAYLDGEITPPERTEIEAHLAGCPTCTGELAAMQAVRHQVGATLQAVAATAAPSSQAWAHLQARLSPQPKPSWAQQLVTWLLPARPRWRTALVGLVLLCLLGSVITAAFYPGGLTALAQGGIERLVRIVRLPASMLQPTRPPTQEPLYVFVPLAEAQRQVDFHVYTPTYVPAGLTLVGAKVTGPDSVWLHYEDASAIPYYEEGGALRYKGDGTISRLDLQQKRWTDKGKPAITIGIPEGIATTKRIEPFEREFIKGTVGGAEALWLESPVGGIFLMVWEHDGFVFTMLVSSWRPGLSVSEAIKIAESLQ